MEVWKIFHSLFLLCCEFMPAQLAPLSHGEESRGVIGAFSSVVSFEINCNHVLWQKGRGEGRRKRGRERERESGLILDGYVF